MEILREYAELSWGTKGWTKSLAFLSNPDAPNIVPISFTFITFRQLITDYDIGIKQNGTVEQWLCNRWRALLQPGSGTCVEE